MATCTTDDPHEIQMDSESEDDSDMEIEEEEEEEEDTPVFRLPFSVGCCPRTVSIGLLLFLHLLLNVALDRRPA